MKVIRKLLNCATKLLAVTFFPAIAMTLLKETGTTGVVCGLAIGFEIVNFLDLGQRYFQKNLYLLHKQGVPDPEND